MLVLKYDEMIDRKTFDRLFNEAWEKISAERQRLGDRKLREHLWHGLHANRTVVYEVDDYIVGVCSWCEREIDGKKYVHTKYPTYGKDRNGSRAWFYDENLQKLSAESRLQQGYAGVVVAANPSSPAGAAVASSWGGFDKYWGRPEIVDSETVFTEEEMAGFSATPLVLYKIPLLGA